tara:strand:+ start:4919 stop:5506 length:588 start_codon:yes stop_codon:yes gene_type:complete
MIMSDKVIMVDCDGVLLEWTYSFFKWMKSNGYEPAQPDIPNYCMGQTFGITPEKAQELIEYFNQSAAIGWLTPFRDAVKYVRKLNEDHGYIFHVITSLSDDIYAGKLRKKNLEAVFGKKIFEEIICLPCGAEKHDALEPYRDSGCIWCEDKPSNAVLGAEMGLVSYLLTSNHSKDFYHPKVTNVRNWRELYDSIV